MPRLFVLGKKNGGKPVIRNGQYEGELGVPPCTGKEFFANVEELYRRYKHSIPSERSESRSRRYFTALPERELDDEDMQAILFPLEHLN